MTKKSIRVSAIAAALLFGLGAALPSVASAGTTQAQTQAAQTMTKKPAAQATMKKMAHKGSASVKMAQEALNKQGAGLSVDGMMGPKTRAAIKSFQKAHKLKVTGRLDKATRSALKAAS
ncbi:Putative peptidoglycan binding domain-containing protein [Tistlia consotensis]|uniref:Putative peptidoglycan binding domain-containing protein n=1 Tax=Tistlia consotensis USBA 355 TaxID=560819 RepID=A0A1Y6C2P6_9PROT|nr:peptidoglycan-binding domain-containing protein [Tistlia consotensis]SMF38776.1 Putative peptidoglycan binding domain-containing protein [Tistlia consotensis USBA 355]SNR36846.1 Putative peptidoglycan binding domain-containing protein [Tistlia consotensis]